MDEEQLKKLPPAVREGFEKAQRDKEGDDNPFGALTDMMSTVFKDVGKK